MCDLGKEVKLLREKVELMEKLRSLTAVYYDPWDSFTVSSPSYPYDPFTTLPNRYPTTWGTN